MYLNRCKLFVVISCICSISNCIAAELCSIWQLCKWVKLWQYLNMSGNSCYSTSNDKLHTSFIYPYIYLWPPLTSFIELFVHLRLFLSLLKWSETKMKRLCIIFERIRGVPQQSGESYSRKATRVNTGNRYREIKIRLLLITYSLINQAIKYKETVNSSNYTLFTYLSDIEWDVCLAISA